MRILKNNDAISTIIGTLLIVVLVTILASITALFVYQYLGQISKPYMIEFTVRRLDPSTIEIYNQGGPSLKDLKNIPPGQFIIYINEEESSPVSGDLNENVGSFADYNANIGDHLKIIGQFNDEKRHILYDGLI